MHIFIVFFIVNAFITLRTERQSDRQPLIYRLVDWIRLWSCLV